MDRLKSFKYTKTACYLGAVVQSTVSVFLSLLVMIFSRRYGIPLAKITVLLTVNFVAQFATDLAAIFIIDKIGRRTTVVVAHVITAVGFAALGILPEIMTNVYSGIFISVLLFSIGGGLLEVIVSPIFDACPSENKAAEMSRMHAMFSIGSICIVLISTAYFAVFGQERWRWLPFAWSALALMNAVFFMLVPIGETQTEGGRQPIFSLLLQREFLLFAVIMICGGAAEIAMSQWASAFAEASLGVSKTVGDILGPCMFAAMMAASRLIYPKIADRVNLMRYIMLCSAVCIAAYMLAAFSPIRILALAGCGLCGFSVGIMWPGTLSLAAARHPEGGTAIFALMALAGDIGCTAGPALVGAVSAAFGGSIRTGLLAASVFPIILFAGMKMLHGKKVN